MKMSMTPQKRSSSFWDGVIQCSYAAAVTGATSCLSVARSFSLGWFARWALFVIADTSITPCTKKLAIPRFETTRRIAVSILISVSSARWPQIFPPPYCPSVVLPSAFYPVYFLIVYLCCFLSIFLFVLPSLLLYYYVCSIRLNELEAWISLSIFIAVRNYWRENVLIRSEIIWSWLRSNMSITGIIGNYFKLGNNYCRWQENLFAFDGSVLIEERGRIQFTVWKISLAY